MSDCDMESANKVAPVADTLLKKPTKCNAKIMCHIRVTCVTIGYSKESIDDNASTTDTVSAESAPQVKLEVKQGGVSYSQTDNG
jgi:hypothetical protein